MAIKSSVKFEWLKSSVQIKEDTGFNREFYSEMGQLFKKRFSKYVPWDSTNASSFHLARMVQVRPTKQGATIVYSMKYARPQHEHTDYSHDKSVHPLATDHWDQYCWTNEKGEITRELNKLRKRCAKK